MAQDLNDFNVVVGYCTSFTVGVRDRAFVWDRGVMRALNDLIPASLNLDIKVVWAINNSGQIAGQASLPEGNGQVAVRLTPIPAIPGDFNCDHVVNVDDVLGVINHWGILGNTADFNGNGIVDLPDLLITLEHWTRGGDESASDASGCSWFVARSLPAPDAKHRKTTNHERRTTHPRSLIHSRSMKVPAFLRLRASVIGAVVIIALLGPGAKAATDPDTIDSSVRMLRKAVNPQRDGSHLPLLFALRQLRDPDLNPIFTRLAQSKDWQIQVHGVLGLAEIDPAKRLDTALVSQLALQAQESIVATGLDLQLLPRDAISTILAIEKLDSMARLILLAELVSLGETADTKELQVFAGSDDHHIAGLASCLLAQAGDAVALSAFQSRVNALTSDDQRTNLRVWLLEAVRRYRLAACLPWVLGLLNEPVVDPDLAYRGVFTFLELDPKAGVPLWKRFLGDAPTDQQRVRYGLILLSVAPTVPAATFDHLAPKSKDDELLAGIVGAGKAIASNTNVSEALVTLADLEHAKTMSWMMVFLEKRPPEQSGPVYQHMIDRLANAKTETGDMIALAVQGSSRLFAIDPDAVLNRLRQAPDDSVLQQAILLGLFESSAPSIGEAAASLRRIGSGKADSLALLLIAKHAKSLNDADMAQLGTVASGGGRVSDVLQIQAAWLYLKHAGQIEQTATAIFEPAK